MLIIPQLFLAWCLSTSLRYPSTCELFLLVRPPGISMSHAMCQVSNLPRRAVSPSMFSTSPNRPETHCSSQLGGGCQWSRGARGAAAHPTTCRTAPPPRAKSAWPAVLTEAGSPLASPLHSPPPQISASLFVGGSQPHGHEFPQGRALICPLLGPPSALSVHLSVYVHIYACTYCVCIWVPNEVDEPNPNDSEFPPL